MDAVYTLKIKRDPTRADALIVRYESKEYALAAAAIYRQQCPIVTVTGPDGAEVEEAAN
ncbi:MAG TPA: hypothetical protein VGH23_20735 [Rhizomicrobium sp.]|jgi:hypothetical protein